MLMQVAYKKLLIKKRVYTVKRQRENNIVSRTLKHALCNMKT